MPDAKLPFLIEPGELANQLDTPGLLIVDLSDAPLYAQHHIPGAVWLEYPRLLHSHPPVMGLLPNENDLIATLQKIENRIKVFDWKI